MSFINIHQRTEESDKITFYYEGSVQEFYKLDDATRNEITRNGRVSITQVITSITVDNS